MPFAYRAVSLLPVCYSDRPLANHAGARARMTTYGLKAGSNLCVVRDIGMHNTNLRYILIGSRATARILCNSDFNTLSSFCLATSPRTYNPTDLKRGIRILHKLGEVRLQIRQYHIKKHIPQGTLTWNQVPASGAG
jgi:hypothetical protein